MHLNWMLVSIAHIKTSDVWTTIVNITQLCSSICIHILIDCSIHEIVSLYVLSTPIEPSGYWLPPGSRRRIPLFLSPPKRMFRRSWSIAYVINKVKIKKSYIIIKSRLSTRSGRISLISWSTGAQVTESRVEQLFLLTGLLLNFYSPFNGQHERSMPLLPFQTVTVAMV